MSKTKDKFLDKWKNQMINQIMGLNDKGKQQMMLFISGVTDRREESVRTDRREESVRINVDDRQIWYLIHDKMSQIDKYHQPLFLHCLQQRLNKLSKRDIVETFGNSSGIFWNFFFGSKLRTFITIMVAIIIITLIITIIILLVRRKKHKNNISVLTDCPKECTLGQECYVPEYNTEAVTNKIKTKVSYADKTEQWINGKKCIFPKDKLKGRCIKPNCYYVDPIDHFVVNAKGSHIDIKGNMLKVPKRSTTNEVLIDTSDEIILETVNPKDCPCPNIKCNVRKYDKSMDGYIYGDPDGSWYSSACEEIDVEN